MNDEFYAFSVQTREKMNLHFMVPFMDNISITVFEELFAVFANIWIHVHCRLIAAIGPFC